MPIFLHRNETLISLTRQTTGHHHRFLKAFGNNCGYPKTFLKESPPKKDVWLLYLYNTTIKTKGTLNGTLFLTRTTDLRGGFWEKNDSLKTHDVWEQVLPLPLTNGVILAKSLHYILEVRVDYARGCFQM